MQLHRPLINAAHTKNYVSLTYFKGQKWEFIGIFKPMGCDAQLAVKRLWQNPHEVIIVTNICCLTDFTEPEMMNIQASYWWGSYWWDGCSVPTLLAPSRSFYI